MSKIQKTFKRNVNSKPRGSKSDMRKQATADSTDPRVNFDNARVSKFKRDIQKVMDRKDSNDVRWYSKSPARLTAVGRIPFSSVNGLTPIGDYKSDAGDVANTVPGIMALGYSPNFVSNQAVVEQAYQAMYSDIVHANSRNQSYDYTDLAIMHAAGTEVFAAIALGIRAYGLMRDYTELNMYTPQALLDASGFNPADLRLNYNRMWDDLLNLISQSRQIWLPNTMPIIERRMWMNLNVYMDGEASQSQYYLYKPMYFYKYQGYTDKRGGKLVAVNIPIDSLTWSVYRNTVQSMIDALIPDQDRGIMFGDILKAYGREGIFAIQDIAIDYKTIPTYNPEVLWQIENSTIANGHPVEFYQDNLHLLQLYSGTYQVGPNANWTLDNIRHQVPTYLMMNFHQQQDPTPEQIMIATRLSALGVGLQPRYKWNATTKVWEIDGTNKVIVPLVAGTEVVNSWKFYGTYVSEFGVRTPYSVEPGAYYGDAIPAQTIFHWASFDWVPAIYVYNYVANVKIPDIISVKYPLMEYDNYARLTQNELVSIHNVAINSLYNVPTM